jgi:hypothetical protein
MNQTAPDDWLLRLLDHHNAIPVAGMIVGVIAIVCATIVVISIPKILLAHRQRMAMIDRGMHPDGFIEEIDETGPAAGAPGVPPRPVNPTS